MKRNHLAAALVSLLLVSGCATTGGGLDPRLQQAIDLAIATARTVCNVLPFAEDLAKLFGANPDLVDQGAAVGQTICNALPPSALRSIGPSGQLVVRVFGTQVHVTRL